MTRTAEMSLITRDMRSPVRLACILVRNQPGDPDEPPDRRSCPLSRVRAGLGARLDLVLRGDGADGLEGAGVAEDRGGQGVGDSLAVDDAVQVFTHGLAAQTLAVPTIYERFAVHGRTSVVAGNMYARGAGSWIRPSLTHIARFTRGGNLFGMPAREYDQQIVDRLIDHISDNRLPDLTTLYFMGLDHESHLHGPLSAQREYLERHVDPMVGQFWRAVEAAGGPPPLVIVFSDHGQIVVEPDDIHSLKIGFPFDKEMAHFFTALNLDVHDYPGEDPACDAVMALNGGMAFVYLRNGEGHWADPPDFERDVLPVGRAFWEAHASGRYAPELRSALSAVLLRDVGRKSWDAGMSALTPDGRIVSLEEWFAAQPEGFYLDPVQRLRHHASRLSGDLVLLSNYSGGYYFGAQMAGVHGGLHPDDSWATLAYGWPGAPAPEWEHAAMRIRMAIENRCKFEGGRMASTCDMITGLEAVYQPS